MCRKLAPEKDSLLVEQLLIEQVMGLMSLAEGIEAGICNLLDTGADLLWRESMAVAQEMFVFAGSIDESRSSVEEELTPPFNVTDTKGCTYFIRGLAIALNYRGKII